MKYVDIGVNTLANIESAITSTVANMQDNTQKNIRFTVNPATGIFRYAVYIGTLIRVNNSKWSIMVHADDTVQTIVGERYNSTYYWQELALNSNLAKKLTCNIGYASVGLTSDATINQLFTAMPNNSKLLIEASGSDKCATDLSFQNGCTIEITKLNSYRGWAIATQYDVFGFKIGSVLSINSIFWKTINVT